MKVMSRQFTRVEKLILLVLIVFLLGLGYYEFVDKPVREAIASSELDLQLYDSQITTLQARLAQLTKVQNNLNALRASGETYMASYNNSKEEVAFLNDVLAETLQYTISFSNIQRNGNLIRRQFTLQYRIKGYSEAEEITQRILEGPYRCIVGNISCTVSDNDVVVVTENATFYETMVGGVADAGLPADSASTKR